MYWVTCRLAMRHARLSRTTCTGPVLAAMAAARQASWERSDAGRGACRTSCPGWDGKALRHQVGRDLTKKYYISII